MYGETDASLKMFPHSASRMAAGNTFGGCDLFSPAVMTGSDEDRLEFSTFMISGDVYVYSAASKTGHFMVDISYFDWGEIEERDENGELKGVLNPRNLSLAAAYMTRFKGVHTGGGLRLVREVLEKDPETGAEPFFLAALPVGNFTAAAGFWLGKSVDIRLNGGYKGKRFEIKAAFAKYGPENTSTVSAGMTMFVSDHFNVSAGWYDDKYSTGFSVESGKYSVDYAIMTDLEGYSVNGIGLRIKL